MRSVVGEWFEVIKASGPLGVFVAAMLVAYGRGHIATGRELEQSKADGERERLERERERTELRKELAFWRDIAWRSSNIADQVVGALAPHKDAP